MPKSPKPSTLVLAVCVVFALVLGASSTATAAALTKSTVKKIATKVVKKEAGSLSVASATTAGTATNALALGGKPPSAYANDTIRYPLVSTTLSTGKSFALNGLSPGATYYVHFHLLLGNSPGTPAGNCQILVPGSPNILGWTYGTVFANAVSLDSGAVVTIPGTGGISIACALAATASTFPNNPSFAEATLLNSVTDRAAPATPARPARADEGSAASVAPPGP